MNNKFISTAIFILVILSTAGFAQNKKFGLGIILGEPTGISMKSWINNKSAYDIAAAWSFSEEDAFHIHVDYLYHNFTVFPVEKGQLPLYYGIGGRIRFENKSKVGVRIPVGVSYIFADAPLDIFMEIVPVLELIPDTEFVLNGAVGIRYFF